MRLALCALLLSLVLAWLLPMRTVAAAPPRPGDDIHLGAGSCAAQACHGGTADKSNEHRVWMQKDEHAQAYAHLQGDRARQIARRLKLDKPAHEDASCLACHATDENRYKLGDRFDVRDGVSCELCHGGSSRWLGPHAAPGWTRRPASEKVELGMRDLSTPRARVATCVSCHVGAPGMDVNHDLIAAGHPALVFDAAGFIELMPPHWSDERDQAATTWLEGKKSEVAAFFDRVAAAAGKKHAWSDYSFFDCYSCHHDIHRQNLYARHDPPGRAGSLPYDLASLRVLLVVLGRPESFATYPTLRERGSEKPADAMRAAAASVRALEADADAGLWLARIDKALAAIEQDQTRAPRHLLQQYAMAIRALSPKRREKAFLDAYAKLDEALGEAYDPVRCATLARQAHDAGK